MVLAPHPLSSHFQPLAFIKGSNAMLIMMKSTGLDFFPWHTDQDVRRNGLRSSRDPFQIGGDKMLFSVVVTTSLLLVWNGKGEG